MGLEYLLLLVEVVLIGGLMSIRIIKEKNSNTYTINKTVQKNSLNIYLSQLGNNEILTTEEEYYLTSKMDILKYEIIDSYLQLEYGRKLFIKIIKDIVEKKSQISNVYYGYNNLDDFNSNNEITLKSYLENLTKLNELSKVNEFIKYTKYFPVNINVIKHLKEGFQKINYYYQSNLNEIKRFLLKNGMPPLNLKEVERVMLSEKPLNIIFKFRLISIKKLELF